MSFSLVDLSNIIRAFFSNPIIYSSFTSWLISQLMKGVIAIIQIRKGSFKLILETILWRTGGMPSSHAAVVTSMTTAVFFKNGIQSDIFAVSLIMALVVMRDAMGARRAVGLQASALNQLGRHSADKDGFAFQPLKEIRGHAPLEVVVGALLGVIISIAYALL